MVSGYSEHFSFEELTNSKKHKELVEQNRKDAMEFVNAGKRLSKLLETIRSILGGIPLSVSSGFRNKKLNIAVGSIAKKSKHMVFEACDFTPTNMTVREAFDKLHQAHREGKLPDLRQILEEGTWLHVEVAMSVGDYLGFFEYDKKLDRKTRVPE